MCVHTTLKILALYARRKRQTWNGRERENDIEWEYDGEGGEGTEGTVNMSQCARATRISGVDNSTFRRNRIGNTVVRKRVHVISNEPGIGLLFFKRNRVFCTTHERDSVVFDSTVSPSKPYVAHVYRTGFDEERFSVQKLPLPDSSGGLAHVYHSTYDIRIVVLDIYFLLTSFPRIRYCRACVRACVR